MLKKKNTPRKVNILFTSVGRRVELVQAFKDAAVRLGVQIRIIGADISESAPALAFCDQTVIVPRISDAAYIPALVSVCREHCVHALIPTIDTDLLLLAKERALFTEIGTTVFISAPEKISLCRDKRLTSDYFLSLGLHAPKPVSDIAQYQGGFPAFVKPIDGSSSVGANRADTPEELKMYASQLKEYIIQPFAEGTEYTVDLFCGINGKPIYITPRVRLAVRAGEVLKTKIAHVESILREMMILAQDFQPCGAITVQLIRNERTGVNQYIEINPRFGGGAPLSMKAGADSAEALLRILQGEQLAYYPMAAEEGAIFSRFDQSVCVEREKPTPVRAVIFDLDDTLYNEKEYVKSGYRQVAALLGQIRDTEDRLWAAFCAGKPAIDAVLWDAGIHSEEQKHACLSAYRNQVPEIHLLEGIRQMLQELRDKGIKLGIITDGRPEGQRSKLRALGLEEMVDSIIVTDELGGPQFRKPNDIAFRIMQARLNVPYRAMLYVGDNIEKDFQAPKALGMQWLHFCNPNGLYYKSEAGIPKQIGTIEELRAELNALL